MVLYRQSEQVITHLKGIISSCVKKPLPYSMKSILAHSKNVNGKAESLAEHLGAVSERAAEYAYALELVDSARAVGLLHDLGKYGERFQARLEGKETGIDHWSAGADACLRRYGKAWRAAAWAAALAIEGHHTGLSSPSALHDLLKQLLEDKSRIGLRFSQHRHDHEELMALFEGDGFKLPQILSDRYEQQASAAFQVDVRMLFSTLVDADFIETEAHFKGSTPEMLGRDVAPELRPAELLAELKMEIARRTAASTAGTAMQNVRRDLQLACVKAAAWPSGLFTLGAPTGSGKTLAMLRFALEHALAHPGQVRRIVMVVPYLNILDQTAQEYRTLVARAFPGEADRYLLEHHSLADTRQTDTWDEDRNRRRGMLAENWHAPLVITTSVQFLESLHANRPGACRKLHRFAGAVILMDEVQTIPHKLAILTLATLSRLSERYGTSIVMSTATQPAFDKLDAAVKPFASAGWHPRDIAPKALGLFDHPSRTRVMWPLDPEERISWKSAAFELGESRRSQFLCIVNVKAHALHLMELLKDAPGLLHLSTNMCPRHREVILREVSESLVAQRPCRLISTQCVEAGVDLDFPEVWRSIGPLEAIAQAAGRCNRHGRVPKRALFESSAHPVVTRAIPTKDIVKQQR